MAIIFPREMPVSKFTVCAIEFNENTVSTPSDKGMVINVTQVAEPVAVLTVQTGLLHRDQVREWSGWKSSLRGGLRHFLATDVRRRKPLKYPDAADNTFNPTITGLTRSEITLANLPANYIASVGDRIGLEQNGKYGYYEIVETLTASQTGTLTIPVHPFVHTSYFTTAAKVRLVNAKAKFVLDWQSWSEPTTPEPEAITFTGTQRI